VISTQSTAKWVICAQDGHMRLVLTLEALPLRGGGSVRCPKRTIGEQEDNIGDEKTHRTKINLKKRSWVNPRSTKSYTLLQYPSKKVLLQVGVWSTCGCCKSRQKKQGNFQKNRMGFGRDHCVATEGTANEATICAVPMHAPQANSLWQGVGEVNSACVKWGVEGLYNQGNF